MGRKSSAAADELREWLDSGRDTTVPREPRVEPPDWLAYALRFCRDGDDGLARYLKAVPAAHLEDGDGVRCVCGAVVEVPDREFVECPSSCRWFVRDGETVWAARLPVEQPEEPAAA